MLVYVFKKMPFVVVDIFNRRQSALREVTLRKQLSALVSDYCIC